MQHRKTQLRYIAIGYQPGALISKGNVGRVVLDFMEPIYRIYPCERWIRAHAPKYGRVLEVKRLMVERHKYKPHRAHSREAYPGGVNGGALPPFTSRSKHKARPAQAVTGLFFYEGSRLASRPSLSTLKPMRSQHEWCYHNG